MSAVRFKKLVIDERGQVTRHLVKIGLAFVVLIILVAEIGPMVYLRFSIINDAEDVASGVAFEYYLTKSEDSALEEASAKLKAMDYSDDEIRQCVVQFLPAGTNVEKTKVKVTLVKYANTLVTKHIEQLKKLAKVTCTKEAPITPEKK